jgi:phosphohistidine phosphatase
MRLLVIRHAIAEDRDAFSRTGQDDSLRPLTKEGRWKMERIAKGLRSAARSINALGSSGFVRADQTAKIVSKEFGGIRIETVEALQPSQKPSAILPWLRGHDADDVVAIVGHEPHLSELVAALISGRSSAVSSLSKGGACMVEFSDAPKAGGGSLLWLMEPRHLVRLGR